MIKSHLYLFISNKIIQPIPHSTKTTPAKIINSKVVYCTFFFPLIVDIYGVINILS